MSPAAPDRMKIARISRLRPAAFSVMAISSDVA
jgi:hypothetical protein